jgi:outer membrane protein OmpA-like peptidoglycan-associated protein
VNFAEASPIIAAIIFSIASAAPALAQSGGYEPWAEIETTSVMIGVGGQSGDGRLNMPNLGTNCAYPFRVSGFGAGIQVNISKAAAAGPVRNLTRLEDFSGQYTATEGQGTLLAGAGGIAMKNKANAVAIDLSSRTQGIGLGFSGQGMTVDMPVALVNAPRVYVLEFGFNKDWLNRENKAKLDQLVSAWKCRFGTIEVVGYTDSVGKEDENLKLSSNRATAARDYLLGAGIYPPRLPAIAAGEHYQQVATPQGVRLRANRVVVVTIK